MYMEEIKRTKSEYGGFLPIELNPGNEYFTTYEQYLSRYNTVKAALSELIGSLGCEKIFIPYYYCPSTTVAIKKTGVEVNFYHIDENLKPIDLPDENNSIVLLVDYFGICGDKVKEIAKTIKNAEVILDFAHDFYEEPVIGEHRHNIYSAKKFFGVPDGAYLISTKTLLHIELPSHASGYSEYLIKTYEEGTNAAYSLKKEVDNKLADNYDCMSMLAIGLLMNVDFDRVKGQRLRNYYVLKEATSDYNELVLPKHCVAYLFPFLLTGKGRELKKILIENKVFVPTLWVGEELKANGNKYELGMMNDCVFLPMDQRYSEEDMKYISLILEKNVRHLMHEDT